MTNFGRYEIIRKLGEGATAEVFLAKDTVLSRDVALKVLRPSLVADTIAFNRFLLEGRAVAGMFHPNIATVLEMDQIDGQFFIVMRYIEGKSLADILESEGPLPEAEVLRMSEDIASALSFAARKGFLHRDIKPSNILRDSEGNFVLTDFGLTHAMLSTGLTTTTGTVMGTPPYMAPEVWLGKKATTATDQYALACVVYEALTGKLLYEGDSAPAIMTAHVLKGPNLDQVPKKWQVVLARALAKEASERFLTVNDFVSTLKLTNNSLHKTDISDSETVSQDNSDRKREQSAPNNKSVNVAKRSENEVKNTVISENRINIPLKDDGDDDGDGDGDGDGPWEPWKIVLTAMAIITVGIIAVLGAQIAFPLGTPGGEGTAQLSTSTVPLLSTFIDKPHKNTGSSTIDAKQFTNELPAPTITLQPAVKNTTPEITAQVIKTRAILRKGPGEYYRMHCYVDSNERLLVTGRNSDTSWLNVQLMPGQNCYYLNLNNEKQFITLPQGEQVWISSPSIALPNELAAISIVSAPPTETPFPGKFPLQSVPQVNDESNEDQYP